MDECEFCNELYSQARLPRILLCGHTFCECCLSQWTKQQGNDQSESKEVECPECWQNSAVPSSPAGFPVNYAILRSIESLGSVASISSVPSTSPATSAITCAPSASSAALEVKAVKCFNCKEKEATLFCQNSCGDLCEECSVFLHALGALQHHVVCSIDKKPQPQRMCTEHKDQPALLFCMQCERSGCVRCGFGSHRTHGVMDVAEAAAEKKALVQQRFEFVNPNLTKLQARLSKIGEEQKLTEHDRAIIAAAINVSAEQLHKAVEVRKEQLQRALEQLASAKVKNLELLQDLCKASLASLTNVDQDLKSLHQQDDMCFLDSCGDWLSAALEGKEVDESPVNLGRFAGNVDVADLLQAISGWGAVHDSLAVQGVAFDQGCMQWSSLPEVLEYEMQAVRLGNSGESKVDELDGKDDLYRTVYQGAKTSCEVPFSECGEFAARVRARFEGGWGPFSCITFYSYEFPPVRDLAYSNGLVTWGSVAGARKYEVQMAGPFDEKGFDEEKKRDDVKFDQAHQGTLASFPFDLSSGYGVYIVRGRAQHEAGWGPFSEPFTFRYGLEWDLNNKTSNIVLSHDANDLLRVVRHDKSLGYGSVMSELPQPSEGIVSFEVRMDNISSGSVFVGVCRTLPSVGSHVGVSAYAIGYCSTGYIVNKGSHSGKRRGTYAAGDVIRVDINVYAYVMSVYKNGVKLGDFDFVFDPYELRAAVSLYGPNDQVTLL